MIRIVVLAGTIITGALIAGIYGGLYDQLTYSISPEFFTKHRFLQDNYAFARNMSPRLGAACIGFLNTWNAGLLIGVVLSLAGMINKDPRRMSRTTFISFLIALLASFFAALAGWGTGMLPMQEPPDPALGVQDVEAFGTVENMNNFSYAGAVIGMMVGLFYHIYKHKQFKERQAGIKGDIL